MYTTNSQQPCTENPLTVSHSYTSTPTTHLNAKKALFSQRLLDIASSLQMKTYYKKNLVPLQHLSLSETPPGRHTRSTFKALLHSHDTLFYRTQKTSSSRSALPVLTPYSLKGRQFSKSVQDHWHIINNDLELHSIWPNSSITAYHKTESLKDILVHSCQAKPTSPRSASNKHHQ